MVVPTRIHMTALSSPSLANEKLVFAPFRIRVAFFIMVLISVSMTVRLTSGLATKSRISYWPRSGRLFSASAGSVSADNRPPIALPKICTKWLDLELPEGRCIGVSFAQDVPDSNVEALTEEQIRNNPSHWVHSVFHPDEIDYGLSRQESSSTSTLSSSSFWMGRLAMHLALDSISSANSEYPPVLKDSYGRPSMPPSLCGSITHKLDRGVALVAQLPENKDSFGIGIDLEVTARPGKRSIGPRVLTPDELNDLGKLPNVSAEEEVLLRFSLKEAIYKAAHPLICQYVGFQEAAVTPHPDGTASCEWFLESGAHVKLDTIQAHWRKIEDGDFFLTSASAQLKNGLR